MITSPTPNLASDRDFMVYSDIKVVKPQDSEFSLALNLTTGEHWESPDLRHETSRRESGGHL